MKSMNAEPKTENTTPRQNLLPQPLFAITCLLLLALGLRVWKPTTDIGNVHDDAAQVWRLSNPLAVLHTR